MTSRRRLQAVAVLAAVALVAAFAFAFVDFAAADHRTNVQQVVTTSAADGASMTAPTTLSLYVVGSEPFRTHVSDALVASFAERGIDARVVTDLEPVSDRPVLLVAVRESQLSYNPVTPSATVSLGFEYARDGNVTQFGQTTAGAEFDAALVDERLRSGETVAIVLDDENTLFRGGEIRLTDATAGLSSWPGYRAHVLGALGDGTVAALLDAP